MVHYVTIGWNKIVFNTKRYDFGFFLTSNAMLIKLMSRACSLSLIKNKHNQPNNPSPNIYLAIFSNKTSVSSKKTSENISKLIKENIILLKTVGGLILYSQTTAERCISLFSGVILHHYKPFQNYGLKISMNTRLSNISSDSHI